METAQHPVDSQGRCILGAHTSASGGSWNALQEGSQIDASGVQFFTANQRQWVSKTIPEKDAQRFKDTMASTGVAVNMSHGSYLVNLGGARPEMLEKSRGVFKQELERCHALGVKFLAFHPGSAADQTVEQCLDRIVESLMMVKELINEGPTQVLIESTAGQGEQTGHDFKHLRYLMDALAPHMSVGICLDTCHMFAAGYDIRTPEAFDKSFAEFEAVVGLKHLRAFHVNDSLSPLNSRVDRHATLGEGHIGWQAFKLLMTDPRTAMVPKYLETPGELEIWKREIAQLRAFVTGADLPANKPSLKMKSDSGKLRKANSDLQQRSKSKKKKSKGDEEDEDSDEEYGAMTKRSKPGISRSKSTSTSTKPSRKKPKLEEEEEEEDGEEACSHS